MLVPDDTLIAAMADAAEGKGVLVVTPLAADTDAIVARAKKLTIENLIRNADFSEEEAQSFILSSRVAWQVRLKSNGWVFFFPVHDLKPNDDVNNPAYVYAPGNRGQYEKQPYTRWRSAQVAPVSDDKNEQGEVERKSFWSRLMEDDD